MNDEIICADSTEWMKQLKNNSLDVIVTGIADQSELDITMDAYKHWVRDTLSSFFQKVSPKGYIVLVFTDRRHDGQLFSKAQVAFEVAKQAQFKTLWHKIIPVTEIGKVINLGRHIGFSHLLCFSQNGRPGYASPDILTPGPRAWKNGFTQVTIEFIVNYLLQVMPDKVLVDPFCGHGDLLAYAKSKGIRVFGIDINQKVVDIAKKKLAQTRQYDNVTER